MWSRKGTLSIMPPSRRIRSTLRCKSRTRRLPPRVCRPYTTSASIDGHGSEGARQASAVPWSPGQYLKFASQRTRPARDLLAQIPLKSPRTIIDMGCGPGNSTEVLLSHYPDATVTGIDSSADMIARAREALPAARFAVADVATYRPSQSEMESLDLIFSNAMFQWIPSDHRIPLFKRLIHFLRPGGGTLAIQVPDNSLEKSHVAMRAVAQDGPWADTLARLKPGLGPFQTPQQLYDELIPLCSSVDLWHTLYQHPLDGHEGVVEWVKGTGLRPFLHPLRPEENEAFLAKYLNRLEEVYPKSPDGKVLFRFPRLFMIAVRK